MAKAPQSEFKFRRSDTIGAASAEDDTEFLDACFVHTEEYDILQNRSDIRQIVLGRTGSGKSALFAKLKSDFPEHVISIEPQELALTHVSNSSVIRYFSDLGVNLDPFYKLLWRHILTVEVLRTHFASHAQDEPGGLWAFLAARFSGKSTENKAAQQAVQYLEKWGKRFWVELEYRVNDITHKMEDALTGQIGAELSTPVGKGEAFRKATASLSQEQKVEVINRGQRVVSEAQVEDLTRVSELLASVLTDRQQFYYVLIDRLDENWVEDKLRYRLVMTLLEVVKEISKVPHIKVLVAIRRDLLDSVFRRVRDAGGGFQEEKYQSLYLPLHWSSNDLIDVLEKRVNMLVVRRYQKRQTIRYDDVMPKRVDKTPVGQFITNRARRPREIISLFNKCIEMGEGKTRLTAAVLRRAEGEYSRQRMRALGDEWYAGYPGLLDFVDILKKRSKSFRLGQVGDNELAEICLQSALDHPDEAGMLRERARSVVDRPGEADGFKRVLFMVFYRVGLVGLKLETFEGTSWSDEKGQSVSTSEISNETGVVVHPTYWRALGIDGRSTHRA